MNTQGTANSTALEVMNQTKGDNAMTTHFMQTGKVSLMGRMASPTGGAKADGKSVGNTTLNLGSTMAGTQLMGTGTMKNKTYGSPFR